MAIQVMWDTADKQAIRLEFETQWTFAELEDAITETDRFIGSVPHQVDVIIDVEGSNMPRDFMNMAKSLLANPEPRANEGARVIVGASKVVRTGYAAIKKAFGDRLEGRDIMFADTLGDARVMLRGQRLSKP